MKAEQQIFLSPTEFEGHAISLSLDLLRIEFACDTHNTLRDKQWFIMVRLVRNGSLLVVRNGSCEPVRPGAFCDIPAMG